MIPLVQMSLYETFSLGWMQDGNSADFSPLLLTLCPELPFQQDALICSE